MKEGRVEGGREGLRVREGEREEGRRQEGRRREGDICGFCDLPVMQGAASMPKKVPGDLPPYNPLPLSASAVRPPPPHRQVDSPVTPALPAGAKVKTSSFDRIVDKLAQKYPHYSRSAHRHT